MGAPKNLGVIPFPDPSAILRPPGVLVCTKLPTPKILIFFQHSQREHWTSVLKCVCACLSVTYFHAFDWWRYQATFEELNELEDVNLNNAKSAANLELG